MRYVLVHGAVNGPWVFDGWSDDLGAPAIAVDLRLLVSPRTAMRDYAAEVARLASHLPEAPVVVGWSMGGLVALMAAKLARFRAVVVLEPSPPAEVIGTHDEVPLRRGLYDLEAYGVVKGTPPPAGLTVAEWDEVIRQSAGAAESVYGRDERARGIPVVPIDPPLLVIHGDVEAFSQQRGPAVAGALGGESLVIPGASHWALVVGERHQEAVRGSIVAWAEQVAARRCPQVRQGNRPFGVDQE